ncbi:hypothetical protein ACWC3X_44120 [Streptomyces populi]
MFVREVPHLWDTTVDYVQCQLAAEDSALAEPLIRGHVPDLLAAALTTFPNSTMAQAYEPGPGQVGETSL